MSANESRPDPERHGSEAANVIEPLEGEAGIPSVVQSKGVNVSRKGIFAVALLALSLVAVSGVSINRALSSKKDGAEVSKRLGDRPAAAGGDARRLDMTLPLPVASAPAGRMIPAIVPTAEERRAEAIPLRQNEPARMAPEDAPVLLVSSRPTPAPDSSSRRQAGQGGGDGAAPDGPLDTTRRNLETYQRQLQGVVDSLTKGGGSLTPASQLDFSAIAV
jgi:type IV secretion system protein VirB10